MDLDLDLDLRLFYIDGTGQYLQNRAMPENELPTQRTKQSNPRATSSEMAERGSPRLTKRCPVQQCQGDVFSRISGLRRHWLLFHLQMIVMYLCPVKTCKFRSPREDKAKEHVLRTHTLVFTNEEEKQAQLKRLPRILIQNNTFRNPDDNQPPACMGKILNPYLPPNSNTKPLDAIHPTLRKRANPDVNNNANETKKSRLESEIVIPKRSDVPLPTLDENNSVTDKRTILT